jgi:type IV pilus assembly protein PilO
MDLSDPRVPKYFMIGICVAGLLYVYFGTSFLPFTYKVQAKELAELKDRYEKLSLEVNRARQSAKHLPHLEAEYATLRTKWEEANQLLPTQNQISSLLQEISFRGLTCGVDFLLFEPKPPVAAQFYTENPIAIQVEGGYHEIASFLNELAAMTRIVNVRDLMIEQTRQKEATEATAKASFTAVAYTLGGQADAQPQQAQGGAGGVIRSGQRIAQKIKGRTAAPNEAAEKASGVAGRGGSEE